jgi:hypothetical protein
VNLTPHAINVVQPNGDVLTIPPSGQVARVKTYSVPAGEVAGIPVVRVEYGDIEGLPEPQPGTVYIVSTMVILALRAKGIRRNDVVSPDTSPESVVRDEKGNIIGVKRFQTV